MTPEIQKAVEAGKLTKAQGAKLALLVPGTYVLHKSWGFGKIASLDFSLAQTLIDFTNKKGHAMQLSYAADTLQPLAESHILARKAEQPDEIRAMVDTDPAGLVRVILESYGGKATGETITQALVPQPLSEAAFKKWWENTKKLLKRDPLISVPVKKSDPFELRGQALSHTEELLTALRAARTVKEQINAFDQIVKNLPEFSDQSVLAPLVQTADECGTKTVRLSPEAAMQLFLARDEIARTIGVQLAPEAITIAGMLRERFDMQLAELLAELPASKLKRIVLELPMAFEEKWVNKAIYLFMNGSSKVVPEAARLLIEQKKHEEFSFELDRAIREHNASSESIHWLLSERNGPLGELATVRALIASIAALERDQFKEKRERKLHDLLLSDQDLMPDILSAATVEEMRELMRKLLLTTVFEELNKRSLLGRIIRMFPELEGMVSGREDEKQEQLLVSWESLEKRKGEYDDLVNVKIPQNTKDIAIARSYGDLRENFEFKSAKEQQRVLMRRKSELERDLSRARGTDFAGVSGETVGLGTIVTVRDTVSGLEETYTILGAWDSKAEANIVSYLSALAQALIGKRVGDTVATSPEAGMRNFEIVAIRPYVKASVA
jgi:transcription elongation GreA/GreB family factor